MVGHLASPSDIKLHLNPTYGWSRQRSAATYSGSITDGGRGAQVKGSVGVWEVHCACEFSSSLPEGAVVVFRSAELTV